jgi:hypothetical protein
MPRMTNSLPCALDFLGWAPSRLARHLGISERTMRRAIRGDFPLPEAAMAWLAYVTEPVAGHPPSPELVEERLATQPLPDGWGTGDLPLSRRQSMGLLAWLTDRGPDQSA